MSAPPSKILKKEILLPTEVITEILLKLPTMSVLRFRCVSKQWFNILREEYFRNLHSELLLQSGSSSPKILFSAVRIQKLYQKQPIIFFSSPRSTSHHTIKISSRTGDDIAKYICWPMMHCNGLLCIVPNYVLITRSIMVCNPLTLEYVALPLCATTNVTLSCSGLGFAPLSKQYKVVCIYAINAFSETSSFSGVEEQVMKVYTLGDTTWRVVNLQVDFKLWCYQTSGLYADGKIYWVICGPHPNKYRLLSFDVESEQAVVIENLPPIDIGDCIKLGQLGSGVSLFVIHGSELEIWMPKRYSSSVGDNCLWDMRYRISLPQRYEQTESIMSRRWTVQGVWGFGNEDMLIVLEDNFNRRFCYGRISSTQRDQGQFYVDYSYRNWSFWDPCSGYKPSLVSLEKYGCSLGEVIVDDSLDSPRNVQIPQPMTTM